MPHRTPFMVVDLKKLRSNFYELKRSLPDVGIYYAIKSFPHKTVVQTLNLLGCSFDVASNGEIDILKEVGVYPESTIHTHPIKKDSDITCALKYGIDTFVVDNEDELLKFEQYKDKVKLLIRVSFRAKSAKVDLSKKFGCALDDVNKLLELAFKLDIRVKGLSFHVGSQTKDASDHVIAMKRCLDIMAEHQTLKLLDIGGGFPAKYTDDVMDIYDFCEPIREVLSTVPKHIRVICEPGRGMVGNISKTVTSVVGKAVRDGIQWYYLDDGVYGMFSGIIFDHVNYPLSTEVEGELKSCVLAGPTCDSIDIISESALLPELKIGDRIVGDVMGAYTYATATTFNSLNIPNIVFIT
jgi:ornithine decarboxylase